MLSPNAEHITHQHRIVAVGSAGALSMLPSLVQHEAKTFQKQAMRSSALSALVSDTDLSPDGGVGAGALHTDGFEPGNVSLWDAAVGGA